MRTTRPMHLVMFGTGRPLFEGMRHYSSTLNYPKPISIESEIVTFGAFSFAYSATESPILIPHPHEFLYN